MPSRILLVSANHCDTPDPVFPLGLAYLSAALRNAGHECQWHDPLVEGNSLEATLTTWKPDYVGISLRNIDDVLIRKKQTFYDHPTSLVAAIRGQTECPIILGGSGFSIFPERLLELSQADYGVAGEGENALVSLIAALEEGKDFQSIPGLVFRQAGAVVTNRPRPAPPHRELCPAERPASITGHYLATTGMLNVQTQRGCAHRCCYCTYPLIEGREHRRFAADYVVEEFHQLQLMGARYAVIVDSVFNSSASHVSEICEALVESGNQLPWGCFLRPQGLTPDLIRFMKRAGLAHIEFGSDSFCDEVLDSYGKDFTFEDVLRSSELAHKESIDFCHFLIAGGPGESLETLERGFENSQRLAEATIMAVVGMRVYPGTKLYDRAIAEGQVSPGANLLMPTYYLAANLIEEEIFRRLQDYSSRSPSWIAGSPGVDYRNFVARLRQRGIVGPLWSYFSMLQRLGGGEFIRGLG